MIHRECASLLSSPGLSLTAPCGLRAPQRILTLGRWALSNSAAQSVCSDDRKFDAPADTISQVGFRRIGRTSYFCLAKDPSHPSRQVPSGADGGQNVARDQGEIQDRRDARAVYRQSLHSRVTIIGSQIIISGY